MLRSLVESGRLLYDSTTERWSIDRSAPLGLPESVRDVIFSNAVEPQIGDKLLIAAEEWDVCSVEAVAPAGDAIVFKGQVSR